MQFTTEMLQNKPPSLEEGPLRCPAHNNNCVVFRVEKHSIFQKCMEIVKLILLLQVLFFIGWLGKILLLNYHLEYNRDLMVDQQFLNREVGADFPVITNSISNDDLVSTIKDDDTISSTEQSDISPTPKVTAAFPEIEDSYKDDEWSLFKIYPWLVDKDIKQPSDAYLEKHVRHNAPLDNADMDTFEKNTNSKTAEIDFPKVKITFTDDLAYPPMELPNSGLIHVIESRVYDSDDDSSSKSEVPFPLLKFSDDNETANGDEKKLDDDTAEDSDASESSNTSEIDPPLQSPMETFRKYNFFNREPATDASENHDFNMKEILFQPEELTAISKDLRSNEDVDVDA